MALKDLIVRGKKAELLRTLLRIRKAGFSVGTGERPGLTYVGGRQLTVDQIFAFEKQLKKPK